MAAAGRVIVNRKRRRQECEEDVLSVRLLFVKRDGAPPPPLACALLCCTESQLGPIVSLSRASSTLFASEREREAAAAQHTARDEKTTTRQLRRLQCNALEMVCAACALVCGCYKSTGHTCTRPIV